MSVLKSRSAYLDLDDDGARKAAFDAFRKNGNKVREWNHASSHKLLRSRHCFAECLCHLFQEYADDRGDDKDDDDKRHKKAKKHRHRSDDGQ